MKCKLSSAPRSVNIRREPYDHTRYIADEIQKPGRKNPARRLFSHLFFLDWHISLSKDPADCSIKASKDIGNGRHSHVPTVYFLYLGPLGFSENHLI